MNPEDQNNQNAPAPGSPQGIGAVPPPSQGPAPLIGGPEKSKKVAWIWLVLIAVLLVALFLGWLWWKDKDKKDATSTSTSEQQTAVEEEVTCDAEFTHYENAELGFGFCYPTAWGEVSVVDAKFDAADTGERWTVKFADKAMVNLGVVSDGWSTEVARDGTCVDPAAQTLPAFSPFSTTWETEGTPVMSATRGIEVLADSYLIDEMVDDLLTSGACIYGYTIINGDPYTHTTASYSAEFAAPVTTPQQHIDDPNILITEANRDDFYTFVKSVHTL